MTKENCPICQDTGWKNNCFVGMLNILTELCDYCDCNMGYQNKKNCLINYDNFDNIYDITNYPSEADK